MIDQVEQRDLAGQGHPGQGRVLAERQPGLGVDVIEQGAGGRQGQLGDGGVEIGRRPAAAGEQAGRGDPVLGAEAAGALEFQRHVDPPRLERGDQVIEPGQRLGVEGLGVVARVVEQAATRAQRHVEIAQPDQVDAGSGQPVGQGVGPFGLQEGRRRASG